jgi:hypothetical protein
VSIAGEHTSKKFGSIPTEERAGPRFPNGKLITRLAAQLVWLDNFNLPSMRLWGML